MTGTMCVLPEEIVVAMRREAVPKTEAGLQLAFGISYSTWRRIDRGEPIRSSVADRLLARMSKAVALESPANN